MASRKLLRPALNVVSDIGTLALYLQQHSDEDIAAAVALLRSTNDPLFTWLVQALAKPQPLATDANIQWAQTNTRNYAQVPRPVEETR